jgi:hypothetical protein
LVLASFFSMLGIVSAIIGALRGLACIVFHSFGPLAQDRGLGMAAVFAALLSFRL